MSQGYASTAEGREAAEVRYSLKDPIKFALFLQNADIRLVRCRYLQDLVLSKRPMPRRQEAESESFTPDGRAETALVSHEEVDNWAKGGRNAIICSISHAWETREHPDPCRFQLQQIVNHAGLFQAAFEGDVWIFYDYISLYQFEREPGHEQGSFGKAMNDMHIMYAHECTMTFRIESLTPEDVWEATKLNEKELIQAFDADSKKVLPRPLKDLVENRTDYAARGWCKAETEWSSLRTVNAQHQRIDQYGSEEVQSSGLNASMPMTPANFREQMEKAKFTHRSDADSVIRLQEKIFYEKVTMCESLVLEGLAASQVAALAEALPSYKNLKNLKITNYECGEAEAKALGEALASTKIQRLGVLQPPDKVYELTAGSGCSMGKAIAATLKGSSSIRYISLNYNRIGPEAAQAIAEALKVNKSLQKIELTFNDLGPGAKAIAEALKANASVQICLLGINDIGPDEAKAIAEALKVNKRVQKIELAMNGIGPEGAKAIAEALKLNASLQNIDLCGTGIGTDEAKAIVEALKVNKCVQKIGLALNPIDPEVEKAVEEALERNRSASSQVEQEVADEQDGDGNNKPSGREPFEMPIRIQVLAEAFKIDQKMRQVKLGYNDPCDSHPIGDEGCKAISAALKTNSIIEEIDLRINNIGSEGAQALAEALKTNQTIRKVDFAGNQIGDEGCKAIAAALKTNRTIEEIRLDENNIGLEGAQALAEALKVNKTMREVKLRCNSIGDEGCKAIAAALTASSIEKMDLAGNRIGSVGRQALAEALKANQTMREVDLCCNELYDEEGIEALEAVIEEKKTMGIELTVNF